MQYEIPFDGIIGRERSGVVPRSQIGTDCGKDFSMLINVDDQEIDTTMER
jgi:hypothetical protein